MGMYPLSLVHLSHRSIWGDQAVHRGLAGDTSVTAPSPRILFSLHHTPTRELSTFLFSCVWCIETVASWQNCIDYNNTTTARLSKLGQHLHSPGVCKTASSKHQSTLPNFITPNAVRLLVQPPSEYKQTLTRQHWKACTRDPWKCDSSALSLPAHRLQRNFPQACPYCLAPRRPRKNSKHCVHRPRQKKLYRPRLQTTTCPACFVHDAQATEPRSNASQKPLTQTHCRGTSHIARCC